MVGYLLPLRFLLLLASLSALVGAAIMFWLAAMKLHHGADILWRSGSGAGGEITAVVLGATDAFLFGVVLIIFAFAITFGFVLQLDDRMSARLPGWMHVHGIKELKHTLVEVIIVYLVVDFATDVAAGEGPLAWQILVKPISIVLIALALRLMETPHPSSAQPRGEHSAGPPPHG
jgi:uncharacterized membrane protein YqhA